MQGAPLRRAPERVGGIDVPRVGISSSMAEGQDAQNGIRIVEMPFDQERNA
jgi:hypothetical protein